MSETLRKWSGMSEIISVSDLTTCLMSESGLERVAGIEPAWPAWKAGALPLSYTRKESAFYPSFAGWT